MIQGKREMGAVYVDWTEWEMEMGPEAKTRGDCVHGHTAQGDRDRHAED